MYSKFFSILFTIILSVLFAGCNIFSPETNTKDTKKPGAQNRIYSVQTIGGMSVEDFIEKNENADNWDCPLEIELYNSQPDTLFEGQVKLYTLGWLEISECAMENSFIVDTNDKLGPVEFIVFYNPEITETHMEGMYALAGPAIDSFLIEFTAVLKE